MDVVYSGMRGTKDLVCETSVLDPDEGIRFRGCSIPECQELLPEAKRAIEPLVEGLCWLRVTGQISTEEQVPWLSKEWAKRALSCAYHVLTMLDNSATNLHPHLSSVQPLQLSTVKETAGAEHIDRLGTGS